MNFLSKSCGALSWLARGTLSKFYFTEVKNIYDIDFYGGQSYIYIAKYLELDIEKELPTQELDVKKELPSTPPSQNLQEARYKDYRIFTNALYLSLTSMFSAKQAVNCRA